MTSVDGQSIRCTLSGKGRVEYRRPRYFDQDGFRVPDYLASGKNIPCLTVAERKKIHKEQLEEISKTCDDCDAGIKKCSELRDICDTQLKKKIEEISEKTKTYEADKARLQSELAAALAVIKAAEKAGKPVAAAIAAVDNTLQKRLQALEADNKTLQKRLAQSAKDVEEMQGRLNAAATSTSSGEEAMASMAELRQRLRQAEETIQRQNIQIEEASRQSAAVVFTQNPLFNPSSTAPSAPPLSPSPEDIEKLTAELAGAQKQLEAQLESNRQQALQITALNKRYEEVDRHFSGLVGQLDIGDVKAEERYQKALAKIQQLKNPKEKAPEVDVQKQFILDLVDKSLTEIANITCEKNTYEKFVEYVKKVGNAFQSLQNVLAYCSKKQGAPEYVANLDIFIVLCLMNFKTNFINNERAVKKYSKADQLKVINRINHGIMTMQNYVKQQFEKDELDNPFIANTVAGFLEYQPIIAFCNQAFENNISVEQSPPRGFLKTVLNLPWTLANAGSTMINSLIGDSAKFRASRPRSQRKTSRRRSMRRSKKSPTRTRSPKKAAKKSPKRRSRR